MSDDLSLQLPLAGEARAGAVLAEARAQAPNPPPAEGFASTISPPLRCPRCGGFSYDTDAGGPCVACASAGEPKPNSPEGVGFAPPPREHRPHRCKDCDAEIFWAAVLDEQGRRKKRDDGRFSSMPVNAAPAAAGNVILFHRPGEGIVCRVLRKGELPPPGAVLRTSHFSDCPAASQRRRSR